VRPPPNFSLALRFAGTHIVLAPQPLARFTTFAPTRAPFAFALHSSYARLRDALETNPHVPAFLLGKRELPQRLPDYIGLGDEREAMSVADQFKNCWSATAGALDWLQSQT